MVREQSGRISSREDLFGNRFSRLEEKRRFVNEQTRQNEQKENEEREDKIKKQLDIISRLKTYKGSNDNMGKVIATQGYSFVNIGSAGIPAAYREGVFTEFNPDTNEIITKRVDTLRRNRYNFPVEQRTTILNKERVDLSDDRIVNALNRKIERGDFNPRGSTSQDFAGKQRIKLEKEASSRIKQKKESIGLSRLSDSQKAVLIQKAKEDKRIRDILKKTPSQRTPIEKQRLSLFGKSNLEKKALDTLRYNQLKRSEKLLKKPTAKEAINALNLLQQIEARKNVINNFSSLLKIKSKTPIIVAFRSLTKNKKKEIIKQGNNLLGNITGIKISKNIPLSNKGLINKFKKIYTKLDNLVSEGRYKIEKGMSVKETEFLRQKQSGKNIIKKQIYYTSGAAIRGLSLSVLDIASIPLHPVSFFKSQIEVFKNPKGTIRQVAEEFRRDPLATITRYYTFSKGIDLIGRSAIKSPVGKYVSEEIYIKSFPKKEQRFVRKIIKSAEVQKALYPVKIKEIRNVNFYDVKAISKIEADAVLTALRNDKSSILFGSKAARITSGSKTKIPKDLDLATQNINKFYFEFKKALPNKMKPYYKLKGEKIYRIKGKKLEPIFDVKPLERLIQKRNILTRRGELPTPDGKLTFKTARIEKVKGIRITGFGEQTLRKALGTLQVLVERNSKRAKDPQAFVEGLQIQIEGLKSKKFSTKIGEVLNKRKIKKLESAVKLLTSKEFAKLLESKVIGITKEYPILKKLNTKRLKKVKRLNKNEIKRRLKRKKKKVKKVVKKRKKLIKKKTRKKRNISKLPSSKLSRLPISTLSRLPVSTLSKLPSSKLSRLPISTLSRLPVSTLSKLPTSSLSKLPSSTLSKLPKSRLKKIPKTTKKIKPILIKLGLKESKKSKGYVIYVKKSGRKSRYVKLNNKVYSLSNAKNLARYVVDNTRLASYRIMGVDKKPTGKFSKKVSLKKFRPIIGKSKLPVRTVVERRRHRIDTSGEKRDITAKSLLSARKKRKRKAKKVKKKSGKRKRKRSK